MREARLASGFWLSAKIRQINAAGGFASVLVKGHDEAGSINLVLRTRENLLKIAVPALQLDGSSRQFEWQSGAITDVELGDYIASQLRFDSDLWFVEFECDETLFLDTFDVKSRA